MHSTVSVLSCLDVSLFVSSSVVERGQFTNRTAYRSTKHKLDKTGYLVTRQTKPKVHEATTVTKYRSLVRVTASKSKQYE